MKKRLLAWWKRVDGVTTMADCRTMEEAYIQDEAERLRQQYKQDEKMLSILNMSKAKKEQLARLN